MARSEARRQSARRYYTKNRTQVIEARKAWALANPDRNKEHAQSWKANNPDKRKSDALRRKYGISLDDYNAMHDRQCGVCAVCGEPETVVMHGRILPLSVDHNHATGAVRELLCAGCNKALAYSKESPEVLRLLANYIEKHSNVQ